MKAYPIRTIAPCSHSTARATTNIAPFSAMLLLPILIFCLASCTIMPSRLGNPSIQRGDYLGEHTPTDSALLFAPHLVSTGANERDLVVAPDGKELFFCREVGGFRYNAILHTTQINGKWTKPEVLPFCRDAAYKYLEPHLSPDGSRLYFVSNKPTGTSKEENFDIWVSDKKNGQWEQPTNIGAPVNTSSREFFPSVTADGTIYFTHLDTAAKDEYIYRSRYVNGRYLQPEKLNPNVNMGKGRFNALVAPDESYIIVPAFGMPDSYGGTDYYIVFRDSLDRWSKPINMGNKVNSDDGKEWSASLSPDGKYLFFMSARRGSNHIDELSAESIDRFYRSPQNGNTDIYWIGTAFIEELRRKAQFE